MTAIFSVTGLSILLQAVHGRPLQTAIATTVLVVLSISHYFPLRTDLSAIAKQSPPQYMPTKLLDAMRSLKQLSEPGEAILSAEATGNFLIAYSGRPVVIGQKIQTARYFEKGKLVSEYLRTPANSPRSQELFAQSRAKWLFWGPEEYKISGGFLDPDQAPYLAQKYNNGFARIFKLK